MYKNLGYVRSCSWEKNERYGNYRFVVKHRLCYWLCCKYAYEYVYTRENQSWLVRSLLERLFERVRHETIAETKVELWLELHPVMDFRYKTIHALLWIRKLPEMLLPMKTESVKECGKSFHKHQDREGQHSEYEEDDVERDVTGYAIKDKRVHQHHVPEHFGKLWKK